MDLRDVLAQALKLENDGREFYTNMIEQVSDIDGKTMFKQLADDETNHFAYIKRQYDALQTGKGWTPIPEMQLVASIDAVSLIFPPDLKVVVDLPVNPTEEDALLFALSVEDKSFKLYHGSAQATKDADAKKLFLQLAGAEQIHFQVLMQRYESRFGYPR